jgi:hypothetical protein
MSIKSKSRTTSTTTDTQRIGDEIIRITVTKTKLNATEPQKANIIGILSPSKTTKVKKITKDEDVEPEPKKVRGKKIIIDENVELKPKKVGVKTKTGKEKNITKVIIADSPNIEKSLNVSSE